MSSKFGTKYAWLALAWVNVGLAIVGAALPLLPTTPFLLVAAFSFSRSSDKWHQWLINHPQFGPLIQDWREHGVISRRTKVWGTVSLVAAMAIGIAYGVSALVLGIQAAALSAVGVFLWSRPETPVNPARR